MLSSIGLFLGRVKVDRRASDHDPKIRFTPRTVCHGSAPVQFRDVRLKVDIKRPGISRRLMQNASPTDCIFEAFPVFPRFEPCCNRRSRRATNDMLDCRCASQPSPKTLHQSDGNGVPPCGVPADLSSDWMRSRQAPPPAAQPIIDCPMSGGTRSRAEWHKTQRRGGRVACGPNAANATTLPHQHPEPRLTPPSPAASTCPSATAPAGCPACAPRWHP